VSLVVVVPLDPPDFAEACGLDGPELRQFVWRVPRLEQARHLLGQGVRVGRVLLGHRGRQAAEEAQLVKVRIRRVRRLHLDPDRRLERPPVRVRFGHEVVAGVCSGIVHLDDDLSRPRHLLDGVGDDVVRDGRHELSRGASRGLGPMNLSARAATFPRGGVGHGFFVVRRSRHHFVRCRFTYQRSLCVVN
jgi:hypothetical protein